MKFNSFCLALAVSVAMPLTASADFIINSFENGSLSSPVPITIIGDDGTGGFSTAAGTVTDGTSSYEVTPSGSNASFLVRIDARNQPGLIAALQANPVISFDTTSLVDPDTTNSNTGFGTVHIVNTQVGGFDDSAPNSYFEEFVGYGTGTVTSTYTITPAQLTALADPNNDFAEITLGVNGLEGEIPTVYFDNIRVLAATVPEPSSLALLGLGGLALSVRRRRR